MNRVAKAKLKSDMVRPTLNSVCDVAYFAFETFACYAWCLSLRACVLGAIVALASGLVLYFLLRLLPQKSSPSSIRGDGRQAQPKGALAFVVVVLSYSPEYFLAECELADLDASFF